MGMSGISRRRLLQLGSLALLGSGCGVGSGGAPRIRGLRDMMPNTLMQQFWRQQRLRESPSFAENRSQLFKALREDEPQSSLSLLGGDWLDLAIQEDLLQPFTPEQLPQEWPSLDPRWQQAGQRQGEIWGIPWRWGLLAIAYNRRRVRDPITDWSDLWRPELQGRITLPDHPREVIGLVQKSLGRSLTDPIDSQDPGLVGALESLHSQVLSYTSDDYQQMLRIEDSWVAVGWTEDLLELQRNYPRFEVVIPAAGTSIWFDCWVQPRQMDPPVDWIPAWLDWVLDPEHTPRIVEASGIASVVGIPVDQYPRGMQERADIVGQDLGELGDPLSPTQARESLRLWQGIREAPSHQT